MMFSTCFVARIREGSTTKGVISCRYEAVPSKDWQSPSADNLVSFCFPSGTSNVKPKEYMRPEEFSFTLTAGDGSRMHGFCRRTLQPVNRAITQTGKMHCLGAPTFRYPQVLCIISQHPWFPFFYKVLELVGKMLRQDDLETISLQSWPETSPAAMFLTEILKTAGPQPQLGQILHVQLPQTELPIDFTPPRCALPGVSRNPFLRSTSTAVELEIPPDLGLGPENAGISAARLLYHLPPRVTLTLISSLLLERRIIMTSSAEDKVSAAVHAAAAIIYPFKWHHIYLPLLPLSLKDYLSAPMPYLVGVTSDFLPWLRHMALEEILLVDLDLGDCNPPPDNPKDDAFLLPFASKLLSALETCKDGTLSPTEFQSTPFVASIMQEYFIKLVGKYRLFVHRDDAKTASQGIRGGDCNETVLRAHGMIFEQESFIAHHKTPAVREFLNHLRHSQLFEVFINERLRMLSNNTIEEQTFESKVSRYLSKRTIFGSHATVVATQLSSNRLSSMLKRTASAVRQSSDSVIKGLKTLGSAQDETYTGMARKASSNFTSLQPQQPGGARLIGLPSSSRGHHGRSLNYLYMPSKAGNHTIARSSPGTSEKSFHTPVSLEDVKPEDFFGDVDDDNAGIETEEKKQTHSLSTRTGRSSQRVSSPFLKPNGCSLRPPGMPPAAQHTLATQGSREQIASFTSLVALDGHAEVHAEELPNNQESSLLTTADRTSPGLEFNGMQGMWPMEQPSASKPNAYSTGSGVNDFVALSLQTAQSPPLQHQADSLAFLKNNGQAQNRVRDRASVLPSAAALASRLTRKGDAFGGLLSATISAVSAELEQRHQSKWTAVSNTYMADMQREDDNSWANFESHGEGSEDCLHVKCTTKQSAQQL